jgi:hypothetical protein
MTGAGQGFLPCPPGLQYCVRVSSMPPGVTLARIFTDSVLGSASDRQRTMQIAQETIMGGDLGGALRRAVESRKAGDKESVVSEPGQMQQLLSALSEWYTPGDGEADIWCVLGSAAGCGCGLFARWFACLVSSRPLWWQ